MAHEDNRTRRHFLKTAAVASAATAMPRPAPAANEGGRKPNIVLIMADDLGYETIGANGGTSYKTPVLDRLAATGARFEHCYAQPLCTPSRVKIMTGRHNVRNYVKFGYLDTKETTFGHILKEAGYATCIAGKWQLNENRNTNPEMLNRPKHFGFDEWCLWQLTTSGRITVKGKRVDARYVHPVLSINGKLHDVMKDKYGPKVCTDHILDFMERNREKPFFVYYPMILTHCPFTITPNSPEWQDSEKRKASRSYKGDAKYFSDMVSYMDTLVGMIVDKLDELGLRENTLVMFIGDNGTDKPVVSKMDGRTVAGGKGKTTDAGTRVPFIANQPGTVKEGVVCTDPVDFSDFLPTICAATGTAPPADRPIDGESFLPLLKGEPCDRRDWIYCWYSRSGKRKQAMIFARTRRYKLYASGKFYDIEKDVLEQNPLPAEKLADEAARARKKLQAVLEKYADARPDSLK